MCRVRLTRCDAPESGKKKRRLATESNPRRIERANLEINDRLANRRTNGHTVAIDLDLAGGDGSWRRTRRYVFSCASIFSMTSVSFPGCDVGTGVRVSGGAATTFRTHVRSRRVGTRGPPCLFGLVDLNSKRDGWNPGRTCAASSFSASMSDVIFASSASPFFSILSSPMFARRSVPEVRSDLLTTGRIKKPRWANDTKLLLGAFSPKRC